MHRRQFLAAFASAPLLASACQVGNPEPTPGPGGPGPGGPGGSDGPDAGVPEGFAVSNADASGHSHSFTIQCAHADAAGWTYTAGGAHTHQVSLTAEQLAAIFAGDTVTVETTGGHPHTWVIARPTSACA
jgi:hypothetical protein